MMGWCNSEGVVNFQNLRIITKKLSIVIAEWSRIHSTFSWFIIDNEVNVVIPTFEWILSNITEGPVRRGIHFDPVNDPVCDYSN